MLLRLGAVLSPAFPLPPSTNTSLPPQNRTTDAYKDATSGAVAHEKAKFKELRKEGKSVVEANRIASKERKELIHDFKSSQGSAEAKADKKDPHQFYLTIKINDKDLIGDDDFMGEVLVTKRQLFQSGSHCHKMYFPVTGVIGEGRQRKNATGQVALIVRLHEFHDEKTPFGKVCQQLMDGSPKERDDAIHYMMQVLNQPMDLFQELDQVVKLMQEPVVEELVCHISDPRRCEAACFALMGLLGDRDDPRNKKTWGFQYRRCIQNRICRWARERREG